MSIKKVSLAVIMVLISANINLCSQLTTSAQTSKTQISQNLLNESIGIADNLVNQGIEESYKSQYDAAIKSWQSALLNYEKNNDKFSQGVVLNYIALAYRNQGQYQKALKHLQEALEIFQQISAKGSIGTTQNNIGLVYNNLGKYEEALKAYKEALMMKKEFDDRRGQATLLNNIGTTYRYQGKYEQALENYQQALTLFKSVFDKPGEGITLNNIGGVYDNTGQYSEALSKYEKALELFKSVNDKTGEGTTLNNIGVLYRNIGQYEDALKNYQQALDILNKLRKPTLIATTLNNIGEVYDSETKYEEARKFYERALEIRQAIQDKVGSGSTLNSIGAVYRNLQQYEEALKVYRQALEVRTEINDRVGQATTLNNMGNVYLDRGENQEALKLYQQALAIYTEVGSSPNMGTTLNNIGSLHLVAGNYPKATEELTKAVEILESLRPGLSDANKVAIFETQDHTYRALQKALVAENKIEQALEIAERGRARAYVELLAKRISKTSDKPPNITPPKIKEIQQIAKDQKATIVEYSIISDKELFIWVVQPTGQISFHRVNIQQLNTSLEDFFANSRRLIGVRGAGGLGPIPIDPKTDVSKETLQKLYKILIEPIADRLPTNPEARVFIVPHKSLFLIPFAALQDANGKYLIEKHTLLNTPAIQVLQFTRKQREQVSGKGALVVGNPKIESQVRTDYNIKQLEGAERESIKIAKILNTNPLIGSQATKAAVLQQMSNARIIHFATHGLLDDIKKLGIPGAIVLAPDSKDNGLLTAAEILKLKLNAELVVLSACDTAQGKLTGDGVIGLSRSLITAGVPSVIVTLWKIPDIPSEMLMTDFYQNLEQNPDKAVALRKAILKTMKKYPNPIDWGAFTLIGEAE